MSTRRGDAALDVHAYERRLLRDAQRAAEARARRRGAERIVGGDDRAVVYATGLCALNATSGTPAEDFPGCID